MRSQDKRIKLSTIRTYPPAVPLLRAWEGSWVIIDVQTGVAVLEVFKSSRVDLRRLRFDKYRVLTIGAYLKLVNTRHHPRGAP